MRRSVVPKGLVGVVLAISLISCGDSVPIRPAAPAPPPEIDVMMKEYSYSSSWEKVPQGRVVFRLTNQGKQPHQPTLLILPEDLPPILEQLRGSARRSVDPLVTNRGIAPRVTEAIAVDLEPGKRYAFVCYAKTSDEQDHSRMGMAWEFRAGPGSLPSQ